MANVDTKLLQIFVELLQKRNASHVAEKMHLTAPAVSHSLNRLREIFNDPLFTRVPHGLVPTPRALELEAPVKRVLALWEQIGVGVRQFTPLEATGTLRVAYSSDLGDTLVSSFARAVQSQAPNLKFELRHIADEKGAQSALLAGELDFLIAASTYSLPTLESEAYLGLQQWLCGRPNHPLLNSAENIERQLDKLRFVVTPEQRFAQPVQQVACVPNWVAQATWLLKDDAVCVLNNMTQPFAQAVFGLTCVPLPASLALPQTLTMHWQASRAQQPMLQWVRGVFSEVVTSHILSRDDWRKHLTEHVNIA